MIRLLVIADDFTGALDTGVQLSSWGARTKVVVGNGYHEPIEEDVEVLVVDAETRHLHPQKAFKIIECITHWAIEAGVGTIYKKTDSALRGNVGAELAALLTASGEKQLSFIPAFPKMRRCTVGGIHYIDGTPVQESVFGKDPFEPVRHSTVAEIIGQSSDIPVVSVKPGERADDMFGIAVYDAATDEDLQQIVRTLPPPQRIRILGGCAGFAALLPDVIELNGGYVPEIPECENILIACGSINPVSIAQCDYAEKCGVTRIKLNTERILGISREEVQETEALIHDILKKCKMEDLVIVDTSSADIRMETATPADIRVTVQKNFSHLLKRLYEEGMKSTVFIMGGDSLVGLMNALEVHSIDPICEVEVGVVLSRFEYNGEKLKLFSKSGGFGTPTIFMDLMERFCLLKKEEILC